MAMSAGCHRRFADRACSARTVAALVGVLGLLSLGACEAERDGADAATVLRVANWGSPAVEDEFMRLERDIRAEFERRHPGVRVLIEQIPGHIEYTQKLVMAHLTGSTPDVVHVNGAYSAMLVNNNVLQDLRPFVAGDPQFRLDGYFANVRESFTRGEALYAIPLDFTTMVMFYNKRLFDQAGVPYPRDGWTWADFLDTARRLTIAAPAGRSGGADLPQQFGFWFENVVPFWVPWLWTSGGDILTADGSRASGALDSRASAAAIAFLHDLMYEHGAAPTPRQSAMAGVNLFLEGRAAMDLKGHWMLIDYRARGLDVGVVGLPTRTGGAPVTVLYAAGQAIMHHARQPRLAWEYIKYMTSYEVQTRRVASGLALSGNIATARHYAGTPVEDAFLASVAHARLPWGARSERYMFIEDLLGEMMRDALASPRLEALEVVHRTAALIDPVLAEPPAAGEAPP